jgi:hypothetical protein
MLLRLVLPAVVIGLPLLPHPAAAQWPPDSLVNLQALPKDISIREIRTMMRGFAGALGVRCIYCHVGDDPNDLASTNFRSDERIQKRKAREMIRMVQRINGDLLAAVPERSNPPIEVTCTTCHHGVTRPMDIRDLLTATALAHGADSAIAEYRTLKAQYYGSASYDFRPFMLANVADRLAGSKPDATIALAEFNIGEHPKDQQSYFAITQILVARGDTATAIRTLERGLEQLPGHQFFQQTLRRLRGR